MGLKVFERIEVELRELTTEVRNMIWYHRDRTGKDVIAA